ncbi:DNA-binding protein [Emticicia aquatilis]|uniref:DNA-binding protein n=1 Tax=Emticicia aquatilis TaxID=1537369 RepID=A0A916Z4R1_9BACT|nr:Crp/Fnr family transcriptional regulator [Emticicia aquatilis]GGD76179.1 DNA-binding protein [Emticicia aquatilis]
MKLSNPPFDLISQLSSGKFGQYFKKICIPKKRILLVPDEVNHKIYFIEKGLMRCYYYANGEEITSWLACENNIICSMASFFTQKPSNEYIETLEESIAWEISFESLSKCQETNHDVPISNSLLLKEIIEQFDKITMILRHLAPDERYLFMLNNYPNIVHRTPLKYLSSYLGMAPSTTSRIRTTLMKHE